MFDAHLQSGLWTPQSPRGGLRSHALCAALLFGHTSWHGARPLAGIVWRHRTPISVSRLSSVSSRSWATNHTPDGEAPPSARSARSLIPHSRRSRWKYCLHPHLTLALHRFLRPSPSAIPRSQVTAEGTPGSHQSNPLLRQGVFMAARGYSGWCRSESRTTCNNSLLIFEVTVYT